MWGWGYRRYSPAKPHKVKGGIKAESGKGSFGKSWWAKRWIEALEEISIGSRLSRGKSYARQGQVMNVDISKGEAHAKVQGTQPQPYKISIKVKTLSKEEWQRFGKEVSQQAIYLAKLMAGEMPMDIEKVFRQTKLSLFPEKRGDLQTDCSCPDIANPCKHIAAVYYILGEEFDRDPFLLFKLRGIEREELFEILGIQTDNKNTIASAEEKLPYDTAEFWYGKEIPKNSRPEVSKPPVDASLLKRMGKFPLWRGVTNLQDSLIPDYRRASTTGIRIMTGVQKH